MTFSTRAVNRRSNRSLSRCGRARPSVSALLGAAAVDDLLPAGLDGRGVEAGTLPLAAHPVLERPRLFAVPSDPSAYVASMRRTPIWSFETTSAAELPRVRHQLVVRHDVVDEAPHERRRRVDVVAR